VEKNLNELNELEKRTLWEGIEKMSLSKMKRRQQLAELSFEKKISILLRLQNMASGISMASRGKCRQAWKISEYHNEV
jgi:hypothetical protein